MRAHKAFDDPGVKLQQASSAKISIEWLLNSVRRGDPRITLTDIVKAGQGTGEETPAGRSDVQSLVFFW